MRVSELMTTSPLTVQPTTPLKEAAQLMASCGISGLPVVEAGRVVGVVSEADVLQKERLRERASRLAQLRQRAHAGVAGPEAPDPKHDARTVAEAMTSPAVTITRSRQSTEAARLMLERGVNRLPVVDVSGKLVGIVTRHDLVKAFTRSDEALLTEIDELLLSGLWLDPSDYQITVKDGLVSVLGHQDGDERAELLRRMIETVPGVVAVAVDLSAPWNQTRQSQRPSRPAARA